MMMSLIKKNVLPQKSFQYRYLTCCCLTILLGVPFSANAAEVKQDAETTPLPVMTVYAQQKHNVPESEVVIDRANLDQTGATDMASIVRYLPLVSAPKAVSGGGSAWDGAGTSGYNIRGIEGNRIGLDIDGVDLPVATTEPDGMKSNSFSSGRDFIDPEMFSQVSIESGTSNVSSDGIGGRITFKTKSPEDYLSPDKQVAATLKSGYSSADDAWFTSLTGAVGNDTLKALVAYAHREGHETQSEGQLKENPVDWRSDAVLAKVLWQLTPQQKLGFTFDLYQKDTDRFISNDVLGSLYPRGASQTVDGQRIRYSIDHTLFTDQFALFDQLKSTAFYQDTHNDNNTVSYYSGAYGTGMRYTDNNYQEKNYGIKTDAQKQLANHHIRYGLAWNQIKSNRPWVQSNPNGTVVTQNRMMASENNKYSLYIADTMQFQLAQRLLEITPGIRAEYQSYDPKNTSSVTSNTVAQSSIQSESYRYLSPNLAISYVLSPNYYLYAKYNRGNRIPTAAEMSGTYDPGRGYSIIGNSNLSKESSDAFEVGLKTTPIEGIKFDLTGFYTKYHNFIDYKQLSSAIYQLQNVAQANIWGAELSTRIDLAQFFPYSSGMSVALVAGKARGTSKNNSGVKGGVNSVQPEKASFTVAYDDPDHRFGLGFTSTAVGAKTAAKDTTVSTSGTSYQNVPGYVIHDLSMYWHANSYVTFNVALNNLFDKKYWDYATVGTLTSATLIDRATLPGRNVVASLAFKF